MLQQLQRYATRIVMGVAFYLFGFFVVANALDLGDREIVIGLVAGLIGGVTMLLAVMIQERGRPVAYSTSPSVS
jgi:hypothetical protein